MHSNTQKHKKGDTEAQKHQKRRDTEAQEHKHTETQKHKTHGNTKTQEHRNTETQKQHKATERHNNTTTEDDAIQCNTKSRGSAAEAVACEFTSGSVTDPWDG